MTTVGELRVWLEQFQDDDVVYGHEAEDTGIVAVDGRHVRFLHAARTDGDVKTKLEQFYRFERVERSRRNEDRRYHGD